MSSRPDTAPARPRTLCGRPANPFLRLRPRNPLPATPALRATLPRSPACSALCAATRKSPRHKTRPQPPDAYPRKPLSSTPALRATLPRSFPRRDRSGCGQPAQGPRTPAFSLRPRAAESTVPARRSQAPHALRISCRTAPAPPADIFPNFPAQTCPGSLFRPCHESRQFFSIVRARSAVPRRLPACRFRTVSQGMVLTTVLMG